MNKAIGKVKFISRNVLAIATYYSRFNLLYSSKISSNQVSSICDLKAVLRATCG